MPYYELLKEAVEAIREMMSRGVKGGLPSRVSSVLGSWHLYNRHCSRCGRGPIGHDTDPALCDDCLHNHDHGGEG